MVSRHIEAGVHRLSRVPHHRIMVHASAATRSYCNQVGRYFVRRAGDIDLVPAGEEGGFEAETAFDTIEIVLQPALMERVAAELGGSGQRGSTHAICFVTSASSILLGTQSDLDAGAPSGSPFADSIGAARGEAAWHRRSRHRSNEPGCRIPSSSVLSTLRTLSMSRFRSID